MIQDRIIMICNIFLCIAPLMQIIHTYRVKTVGIVFKTCITTAVPLAAFSACLFSMSLIGSGVVLSICTLLWFILLGQAVVYRAGPAKTINEVRAEYGLGKIPDGTREVK